MDLDVRQLINSIPQGVIVTDLDGNISEINDDVLDLLEYSREDASGLKMTGFASDAFEETIKEILATVKKGKKTDTFVRDLLTKRGRNIPVELRAGPLMKEKKVAGVVYSIKNLSDEMRLLKELQQRSMQLLASSEVARAATQILDYQELIERCVNLIREHFGFYYAAIFLIDNAGEWAILRAATGEGGKQLLEIGHKLGVGSQSMVGWVTANNAPRIALDVGEEAIRFDNPYLPKTRAEMALPLRVRGDVIGALDVQSTSVNAFTEDDIQTIQMMADQVAIAIDNARLFSERGAAV